MIHPSYVDLMKVVNKDVEEGETPVINSRYSIVMATAKRARQIVDGDEPLVKVSRGEKPLSTAVDELNQGEIRILAEDEAEEEFPEPVADVNPVDYVAKVTSVNVGMDNTVSEQESAVEEEIVEAVDMEEKTAEDDLEEEPVEEENIEE